MNCHVRTYLAALAVATVNLLLFCAYAAASKQVVDFFPRLPDRGQSLGIAINQTGAGAGSKGDIYIADPGFFQPIGADAHGNNRIQRFSRDDSGTPANPSDDTFHFVSAWGAGVDSTIGGTDYQICTDAAKCQPALRSGGNGTLAGNGSLKNAGAIAVDQDTGNVYVSDDGGRGNVGGYDGAGNFRVNVYSGDGTFLRSFGWDVVESGPDDSGTGYEICKAGIDVCKTGLPGAGAGQIGETGTGENHVGEGITVSPPDDNPATGTVFLADTANRRINTYNLDGSSPSSFGSAATFSFNQPSQVTVDSRGIVYASNSTNSGEIERYDTVNANGGGVGFLAPIASPPLLSDRSDGFAVDPDSDGAGPDSDVLYVAHFGGIQQFGPVNPPGLAIPPTAFDDTHATSPTFSNSFGGMDIDQSTGQIYVTAGSLSSGFSGTGVYVLGEAGPPATGTLDALTDPTSHSVTVHATVNPNGPPDTSYRLEYSADGTSWKSLRSVVVGSQVDPQVLTVNLDPGGEFSPNTLYYVRLVVERLFAEPIVTAPLTFTTTAAPPTAETAGAPIRTATTAQLGGRVLPGGTATTYHFEYGDQGPCDVSPCVSTPDHDAGAGNVIKLVSEEITGLDLNTTYHYRVVADNGNPGSPVFGEDMSVTTRSGTTLSHGHFPGPPGSDRAYEQVSAPDTGGNPVYGGYGFSTDGNRAIYQVAGGTPISDAGSAFGIYGAERSASGWQSRSVSPHRDQIVGPNWYTPMTSNDLSAVFGLNFVNSSPNWRLFHLDLTGTSTSLLDLPSDNFGTFAISDDGSRVVEVLRGAPDPAYPAVTGAQLYDISTSGPQLIGFLPSGSLPACSPGITGAAASAGAGSAGALRSSRWVSPDGSLVYFHCGDDLYVRDVDAAQTRRVTQEACAGTTFLKSTSGAAFYWCRSQSGPVGEVYRYDLGDESRDCVTCVVPGLDSDISIGGNPGAGPDHIAVADDGSRVYFVSPNRLLPGAAPEGIYRVNVASGDLAYIGQGADVGEIAGLSEAINPDGSVITFGSAQSAFNPLGGASDNGGTYQYYRYDDTDRSLVCISCPQNGSAPKEGQDLSLLFGSPSANQTAAGSSPLSDDGTTLAFTTTTPMVNADQNTPGAGMNPRSGMDVYEWRDGQLLLITDGLTSWPALEGQGSNDMVPHVNGVSPSGRDIFFTASAQYTPDALDAYYRLYDARIGGGIEFPAPPPPCPLEVCQGTPKGAPEEAAPGTGTFVGAGNVHSPNRHHRKGKKHRKKQHHHRRANHNRRTAR